MPFIDLTAEFRNAVHQRQSQLPDAKRRKKSARTSVAGRDGESSLGKEYVAEAYIIVSREVLPILKLTISLCNS